MEQTETVEAKAREYQIWIRQLGNRHWSAMLLVDGNKHVIPDLEEWSDNPQALVPRLHAAVQDYERHHPRPPLPPDFQFCTEAPEPGPAAVPADTGKRGCADVLEGTGSADRMPLGAERLTITLDLGTASQAQIHDVAELLARRCGRKLVRVSTDTIEEARKKLDSMNPQQEQGRKEPPLEATGDVSTTQQTRPVFSETTFGDRLIKDFERDRPDVDSVFAKLAGYAATQELPADFPSFRAMVEPLASPFEVHVADEGTLYKVIRNLDGRSCVLEAWRKKNGWTAWMTWNAGTIKAVRVKTSGPDMSALLRGFVNKFQSLKLASWPSEFSIMGMLDELQKIEDATSTPISLEALRDLERRTLTREPAEPAAEPSSVPDSIHVEKIGAGIRVSIKTEGSPSLLLQPAAFGFWDAHVTWRFPDGTVEHYGQRASKEVDACKLALQAANKDRRSAAMPARIAERLEHEMRAACEQRDRACGIPMPPEKVEPLLHLFATRHGISGEYWIRADDGFDRCVARVEGWATAAGAIDGLKRRVQDGGYWRTSADSAAFRAAADIGRKVFEDNLERARAETERAATMGLDYTPLRTAPLDIQRGLCLPVDPAAQHEIAGQSEVNGTSVKIILREALIIDGGINAFLVDRAQTTTRGYDPRLAIINLKMHAQSIIGELGTNPDWLAAFDKAAEAAIEAWNAKYHRGN